MDVSGEQRLTGGPGSTDLGQPTGQPIGKVGRPTGRTTARAPWTTVNGFGDATVGKLGMWVFLATDAMGFAGLLLAYGVLRTRAPAWPDPAARTDRALAAALTFTLLLSGAAITAAVAAARRGERRAARMLIVLTAIAGLAFVAGQAAEFHALAMVRHVGLTADHAAATFYVITAYHGLHVLVGVFLLAGMAVRRRIWTEGGQTGRPAEVVAILEVTSLYWQFVDVVWIVLFTVLYLLPGVIRG